MPFLAFPCEYEKDDPLGIKKEKEKQVRIVCINIANISSYHENSESPEKKTDVNMVDQTTYILNIDMDRFEDQISAIEHIIDLDLSEN